MLKNIIKTCLSNFIVVLAGIIIGFVFPLILSIEDYAYYQQYLLYCSYINIFHLGMASGMYLKYAGKNYDEMDIAQYKSEICLLYSILGIFTLIAMIITFFLHNKIYFMVGLSIIPICVFETYVALYQAWNRFTEYAVINTLPKTLFVALVFIVGILCGGVTGENVVLIYFLIQVVISLYFLGEFIRTTVHINGNKIISGDNFKTLKEGFLFHMGNYINILFHSIDRQFINLFLGLNLFAMYSFAMSVQSMITIFITSISQPFYPKIAQEKMKMEDYNIVKEVILFISGILSCSYFGMEFIITNYIAKYLGSLNIIRIFYLSIPAIAIINILYLNFYKVERKLQRYTNILLIVLSLSVLLDGFTVVMQGGGVGIATATMIVYYIWLFICQRDFRDRIQINRKDVVYILVFVMLLSHMGRRGKPLLWVLIYLPVIFIWGILMYKKSILSVVNLLKGRG